MTIDVQSFPGQGGRVGNLLNTLLPEYCQTFILKLLGQLLQVTRGRHILLVISEP